MNRDCVGQPPSPCEKITTGCLPACPPSGRQTTTVRPPNTYISYHGVEAHDFDLKLEVKVEHGGGTGIQYRGTVGGPWIHARPGDKLAEPAWRMTGSATIKSGAPSRCMPHV